MEEGETGEEGEEEEAEGETGEEVGERCTDWKKYVANKSLNEGQRKGWREGEEEGEKEEREEKRVGCNGSSWFWREDGQNHLTPLVTSHPAGGQ